MVFEQEVLKRRGLDFRNQRRAYALRHVDKLSWEAIAARVVNRQGEHPSWVTVRTTVTSFSVAAGRRKYAYSKCGRTAWKLTPAVRRFLLQRLLRDRVSKIVTSASLQRDVAEALRVVVDTSTIRKFLRKKGYKWLPRNQKRKYTQAQRDVRVGFAAQVLRLSRRALRQKLSMAMDGVVLSMPPREPVQRLNYCWGGVTHMWRKHTESNVPRLAGQDDFQKQVPISRAVPFWGGISQDGVAAVLWHLERKKTNTTDWAAAVRRGNLAAALRHLNPQNQWGPWTILCDNESFLRTRESRAAYRSERVALWDLPPHSPDLNPVEMFWGWLRNKLRVMDLADLRARRPPLSKAAYVRRVQGVLRTRRAQAVASRFAGRLRKTCEAVVATGGAAARN